MVSKISEGVNISVETYFEPEYSNTALNEFMFAYRITIENTNTFPIQLISRHWSIFDSNGTCREVEGDGVVGIQPIIVPGALYQYTSGCNLQSDAGKMSGTYLFANLYNKKFFKATIPSFEMFAPFKLN